MKEKKEIESPDKKKESEGKNKRQENETNANVTVDKMNATKNGLFDSAKSFEPSDERREERRLLGHQCR